MHHYVLGIESGFGLGLASTLTPILALTLNHNYAYIQL